MGCANSFQGPTEGIGIAQVGEKEAEERYEKSILKNMTMKHERINSSYRGWDHERDGVTARV